MSKAHQKYNSSNIILEKIETTVFSFQPDEHDSQLIRETNKKNLKLDCM